MNSYREITERIHVSEALNARVLTAAQEQKRSAPSPNRRWLLRTAVCAACALALVLGTAAPQTSSTPTPAQPGITSEEPYRPLILNYTFGIAAGAVENAVNGGLIFRWEDGRGSFRIRGEHITEIILETSKGILLKGEERMGRSIRESFCADTVYSLAAAEGENMNDVDQAELLLTVTFSDGTVKTESYTLQAERLRVFFNEDGGEVLVPALTGDSSENIPALYMDASAGRWLDWPVSDSRSVSLSMSYGFKKRFDGTEGLFHAGIDIPGQQGLAITAAESGTVTETGYHSSLGYYLVLDHGSGLATWYAHCQKVLVKNGDMVEQGQTIALMGSTGMSTGPHLHFEVRQNGEAQNPVAFFTGAVRDTLMAQ